MIAFLVAALTVSTVCLAVSTSALVMQVRAKRAATRAVWDWYGRCELSQRHREAVEDEIGHLAAARIPALVNSVARGHHGIVVPGLKNPALSGTPMAKAVDRVQAQFCEVVEVVREGVGLAARAGVLGVADEAQTHLTRCQMTIFEGLDRHSPDGESHQVLMDLDHQVTRAVHVLQRLRVMAGSWPGVQRANCTFREIVESARGRIDAYKRVDYVYLPGTGEVLVEGRVVEPVTLALAELLSNATGWSADRASVSVLQVQTGYCVVVEDNGVGLNTFQREAAERLLSQHALLDVTNLRDARKLGFAVIGRLACEYGFHVDVSSPSAGGGVRAVLRVPSGLLGAPVRSGSGHAGATDVPSTIALPAAPRALQVTAGERTAAAVAELPEVDTPHGQVLTTVSGLPKRQRRSPQGMGSGPLPMAVSDTGDPGVVAADLSRIGRLIQDGLADMEEGDNVDD